MNLFRSVLAELRRLTTGTMPKVAILAFMALPMLYSGLYLYANYDPYAQLDQLPAAIVVQDAGEQGQKVADQLKEDGGFTWTQTSEDKAMTGVRDGSIDAALIIGSTFTADLESSGKRVNGESETPSQASLTLVTNDANNFMIRTFADSIIGRVKTSIAQEVGVEAAEQFLSGYSDIRGSLAQAVDGTEELARGVDKLGSGTAELQEGSEKLVQGTADAHTGAQQLRAGTRELSSGASALAAGTGDAATGAENLADGLSTLASKGPDLTAGTDKLAAGSAQVAQGVGDMNDIANSVSESGHAIAERLEGHAQELEQILIDAGLPPEQVAQIMQDVTALGSVNGQALTDLDSAVGKVNQLNAGAQTVAQGAKELNASAQDLSAALGQASGGANTLSAGVIKLNTGADALAAGSAALDQGTTELVAGTDALNGGATELSKGLIALEDGTGTLADGVQELGSGLSSGVAEIPNLSGDQETEVAGTIANPVEIISEPIAQAGTYGAGLAPFFISISAWIGSLTMFLLIKPFSKRALAAGHTTRLGNWKIALSGWVVPALIGVFQMVIMFTVIKYAVGINPHHPLATGLFLLLISATFIALIQMLNAWFGTAGQFVAMVLMLLQLVTAGGTFPWQTIPQPIQWLHRILPMSYTIDGLRGLMYGGDIGRVLLDVAVLATMFGGAMFLTTRAVKNRRVWTPELLQPQLVL